ncbi:hypothetical protein KIW84_022024 [Lathyrus oleraceus]|uniref:Uncharacterized protein n=1 Tax=Pisum sativum TaxID=3888 RepID=A0A9D4YAN4_PEA|nr:hypothetical protein KIW84_022024 [Pisum sativum]
MRNSQFFQRRFRPQQYRVSENPFFHELILALTSPFLDRTTTYWSGHDDTPSGSPRKQSFLSFVFSLFRNVRAGHRCGITAGGITLSRAVAKFALGWTDAFGTSGKSNMLESESESNFSFWGVS